MVTIPISVFYFSFGFLSCIVTFIILSVCIVNKQKRERQKLADKYMEQISKLTKGNDK